MGYPIDFALRYLGSKKRAFISVGTAFAVLGVALGVAALATVMSVTGGFQAQFREKVLGVNAHVLVLKYSTDFREYRSIMDQVAKVPGVTGTAPFSINPMMLTHGDATATGVLLKGVDPAASLGVGAPGTKPVLILPQQIVGCDQLLATRGIDAVIACGQEKLKGLRLPGAKPADRKISEGRGTTFDDLMPGDAGAPAIPDEPEPGHDEIDDAGRNLTLIQKLEEDIRRREAEKDAGRGDSKATPAPPESDESPKHEEPVDAGPPPQGDIVPDGGYKSRLPDDDEVLPPDVDPDQCADPAKVAGMPGIVVGSSLAKTLNLTIGDCVTVTSPTIGYSFSAGSLKPPVARRFRVIALFTAGFDQYDSKLVYTDLYEAQTFYDQGDTVTGVEMIVDDIDKAPRISRQISEMLGNGLYHTMDWEELNHGLFTALRIQQIGMSVVLALIILVAAFTVVATLIMVVLDKKKEIAVLKAMGASDSAILRIFLYQGGVIGFAGTSLGLLIGLLLCKVLLIYGWPLDPKVYFISRLPVQVRLQEFLITGQVALAICLEATVIPSLYAGGLNPVDGFREEVGTSTTARRRSLFLSIWLFLMHSGSALGALMALMVLETGADVSLPRASVALLFVLYAAISTCALAALLWKRWGYYGLLVIHGAIAALNWFTLPTVFAKWNLFGIWIGISGAALPLVILFVTYMAVRPCRRYLE